MLSYFILWSLAGPLVHLLIPAAGPIFYEALGFGDRFAGIRNIPETREVADYLWSAYSGAGFGAGSGISAMPSLHIATTGWAVLAIHHFAPRLHVPVAVVGALIFLLSIALGWHYAVDGLVGGGIAWACFAALRRYFAGRARTEAPAGSASLA